MAVADFGKEEGKDYLVSDLQETPAIEDYLNISSDSVTLKTTEGDDPVGQYPPSVRLMYYYHPDYLGNVEYITDMDGLPYQYFSYTPWGEEFKSDIVTPNSWDSPYRFNGKELDEETGLYYYGARYYNPQVSAFLSVDAMAGNNHNLPLTPYHFTANNPVMIIDPDGNDWEITTTRNENDELVINMKYTVAVLNSSSKDIDMEKFAESYKSQMESSYGISYEGKDGSSIHVSMEVDIRVIDNADELNSDEHILTIKDQSDLDHPDTYGYVNKIGGKKIDINANKVDNMMNGNDNNTLVHETGHTAGLNHIDIRSHAGNQYYNSNKQNIHSNNAMFSGGSIYMNDRTSTKINPQQIQWIYNSYKRNLLNLN